ncbi:hypothetical protein B0T19DRAFT_381655 [Cercophora scortea]|uniref:Nephrocystin 3-like N-terminal domain-containing protein n=1 Tax=Cercophora scortea TaxID=314031 RepID=A0AAE0IXB2_9PEZI|nr:hypothetical protein B0T19DRAFT_381655 [Cercophora scortea]
MQHRILDTGLSVAYEPENCSAVVDIIVIHGLQGHPFKTWASTKSSSAKALQVQPEEVIPVENRISRVFWPADLLPQECPRARILMYGYDTKITKYMAGATNKNSVLSHSKDLLFALGRERVPDRPLILVAHSLGGIVVKEMLARSSASTEPELKNVIASTAAVVFLGTPHRGSPDLAALGEWARSVFSSLRMETTSAILDALSLRTTDLERAQETFSQLWQEYDFRVKTFQEGLGLTGINLGVLGNKVVPDYSSVIGDHRERAETIQANHMEMCRFSGADDPNYCKLAGELRSLYLSIDGLNPTNTRQGVRRQRRDSSACSATPLTKRHKQSDESREELTPAEKSCLQSLWYPTMTTRLQTLERPADQTCSWLFEHELYQAWLDGRDSDKHCGLLWLKGKPGAGKSVLMKEAFRRAVSADTKSNSSTAAFFFSAKEDDLSHSPAGLFRSLLYQLLPSFRAHLERLSHIWEERFGDSQGPNREEIKTTVEWQEQELRSFLGSVFLQAPNSAKKTFIFIDALDEADAKSVRSLAFFWREITMSAHDRGVNLHVCMSSRHFPSITISRCPEIVVEHHNNRDISMYVERRFRLGIAAEEPEWEVLRDCVLRKSAGVFLWVVLVVDDILRQWDDGKDMRYLLAQVDIVPEALETLFARLFYTVEPETRQLTFRLFQWATLAVKPLRLHEWHHVLAFIRQPAPKSLDEWRMSKHFTRNDDQLERQIKSLSKGLVEVKSISPDASTAQDAGLDEISVCAGAGSLTIARGETRIVQVIHESVREFFLNGNSLYILGDLTQSIFKLSTVGTGHVSIMATCLDYLEIAELDALVHARTKEPKRESSALPATRKKKSRATVMASSARTWGRKQEKESFPSFETLRAMFAAPANTRKLDILEWITGNQVAADGNSTSGSRPNSVAQFSVTGKSQVLEDYPALLSYATANLFTHARRADYESADPTPVIYRLSNNKTWLRWLALKEDVPFESKILDYASDKGLDTWTAVLNSTLFCEPWTKDETCAEGLRPIENPNETQPFDVSSPFPNPIDLELCDYPGPSNNFVLHEWADSPLPSLFPSFPWEEGGEDAVERPGSVASFGSAGSHGEEESESPLIRVPVHREPKPAGTFSGPGGGEMPRTTFRCELVNPSTGSPCDLKFFYYTQLSRHESIVHDLSDHPPFQCHVCTDVDVNRGRGPLWIKRHYRLMHPDIQRVELARPPS